MRPTRWEKSLIGESCGQGAIGRAFSEPRFGEAFEHLAKDVRWTIVGYMVLEGADAVIQTCRDTLDSLEGTTTTWDRCVVAVDTVARYSGQDGVTAVASCDIYEFTGTKIAAITSYAVEVDPDCAGAPPPSRGAA